MRINDVFVNWWDVYVQLFRGTANREFKNIFSAGMLFGAIVFSFLIMITVILKTL